MKKRVILESGFSHTAENSGKSLWRFYQRNPSAKSSPKPIEENTFTKKADRDSFPGVRNFPNERYELGEGLKIPEIRGLERLLHTEYT